MSYKPPDWKDIDIQPEPETPEDTTPTLYYINGVNNSWDFDTQTVHYSDGIMTVSYRPYNPEYYAQWFKEDPSIGKNLVTVKHNYPMQLARHFDAMGWIEQLGIEAIDAITYYENYCFKKLNGMTARKAWEQLTLFVIQPGNQLQLESVEEISWRNVAILAGAYRPQKFGTDFAEFPIKALYMAVGIFALPALIEALPALLKTVPELADGTIKIVKYLSELVQKWTGVLTE